MWSHGLNREKVRRLPMLVAVCVKDGLKMEKMSSVGSGDDSRVGKKTEETSYGVLFLMRWPKWDKSGA